VPAGEERLLRRRIRSIRSTQKITRAMELIAASRIVRAQQAIAAARPYTEQMRQVVADIASTPEAKGHWVFSGQGPRSVVVVLAADRGLCGAFNTTVLRAGEELLERLEQGGPAPAVIAVGRRAKSYFNFRGRPMAKSIEGISDRPKFEDAQEVVEAVKGELERGDIGQIHLVSTRFLSTGTQKPESRQLVPLQLPERAEDHKGATTVFEFEPEPGAILDTLLPQWLEAEIFTALLESAASFHVAQQRAMKAATDNADDLVKNLQRAMNRARQDSITTEILEIVSGAEALRQGDDDEDASAPQIYVLPEAS
jgi:F-type H+-transporting ATPase subunit gamma